MRKNSMGLRKALVLLSLGGTTFAFGLSNTVCASNNNIAAFYQASGDAAIDTVLDPARALGNDFTNIIVNPASVFLQSLWNNRVAHAIPQDDVFPNRGLVE